MQERPKYCSSPGQQKFMKRMLADLVSQNVQHAASTLKVKESSSAQQRGPSQGMAPTSGSSDSKADLKQNAPNQSISPANARSNGRPGLQQGSAPQSLPTTGALHQSSSQQRPAPGKHACSSGTHGAQHRSANQTPAHTHMTQTPVPAPLNDRDRPGYDHSAPGQGPSPAPLNDRDRASYHHSTPGHRPVVRDAHSSAGPDRTATRQSKLPFVPVISHADPRYKTSLCKYDREGCCPRGDDCSFAHGHAELRKVGGVQVSMLALPLQPSQLHGKHSHVWCSMDAIAHSH